MVYIPVDGIFYNSPPTAGKGSAATHPRPRVMVSGPPRHLGSENSPGGLEKTRFYGTVVKTVIWPLNVLLKSRHNGPLPGGPLSLHAKPRHPAPLPPCGSRHPAPAPLPPADGHWCPGPAEPGSTPLPASHAPASRSRPSCPSHHFAGASLLPPPPSRSPRPSQTLADPHHSIQPRDEVGLAARAPCSVWTPHPRLWERRKGM